MTLRLKIKMIEVTTLTFKANKFLTTSHQKYQFFSTSSSEHFKWTQGRMKGVSWEDSKAIIKYDPVIHHERIPYSLYISFNYYFFHFWFTWISCVILDFTGLILGRMNNERMANIIKILHELSFKSKSKIKVMPNRWCIFIQTLGRDHAVDSRNWFY